MKTQKVSVKFNPSDKELSGINDFYSAVDLLIVNDCFCDNNPMKKEQSNCLFWDWAIVNVDGFKFPTPIHTCDKNNSVLYTANGLEVVMSNEECAYTTALFYIDYLLILSNQWDAIKHRLPAYMTPYLGCAIRDLQNRSDHEVEAIKRALFGRLTENGHRVLN